MASKETIRTPLTKLLGIDYPIILAGMNKAAGPELAAVVSNNGGLGVIGGVFMSPRILKTAIDVLKRDLHPDKKK
jgi:NAD(P)H-dependent flavin oxidoreductase YrpB (nitropropane dioxygenase family)